MRRLLHAWLAGCVLAIAGVATPASAQDGVAQPSFDCAKARAPIEMLICADVGLADLDRALAESYHAALATRVGEAQLLLREEQRAWSRNRAVTCGMEGEAVIYDVDPTGCLIALYRARIADLQPSQSAGGAVRPSGYRWLMGDWNVATLRRPPGDAARAATAKAQIGRNLHLAEAPITTLSGATCSFPHYSAEPAPGPLFGDLSDYPSAVTVRLSCVGIALLEVVRLTDDRILIGEGDAVFELERRR